MRENNSRGSWDRMLGGLNTRRLHEVIHDASEMGMGIVWEIVWELFHSEVIYLMSHLLVLKEVRIRILTKT